MWHVQAQASEHLGTPSLAPITLARNYCILQGPSLPQATGFPAKNGFGAFGTEEMYALQLHMGKMHQIAARMQPQVHQPPQPGP
ncbi:hypothetical protein Y1Q_0015674 [Alligator mississippiensis]|uniref:Uncharacterized protein n=1 Tax=Alligator mississippiensis TaxID=8496 RepID=A0A151NNM8_ALLMI|nr:hypothetical protein Y1Q_0015674 [Alligator mississippiensis]